MSNLSSIGPLSNDIPLFTIDKEATVLDLYRQGKRRREIASIVRMNFSDIKTIIDREFGPKEDKKSAKNTDSVYSQALKLFLGGAKPVTVAMRLGLSYEETRKIYLQFLKLNRMYRLRKVYDELGDDGIKPFLLLYNRMQENNFTTEQITETVNFAGSLTELEEMHSRLSNDIQKLESQFQNSNLSAHQLEIQINEFRRELEYYNHQCEMKNRELSALDSKIISKRKFIDNFDNKEGLIRIKEAAKNEIESVMRDNRASLALAIAATLEPYEDILRAEN